MDRTLFYATGGWAWIDYDSVFSPVLNGTPFRTLASSNNDQGWTLGIGIEHAFDDRWVGRIDYRYSNFGDAEYSAFPQPHLFGDFETHDIRAGIAVRF
jgi:outer membrane immunogenic protein